MYSSLYSFSLSLSLILILIFILMINTSKVQEAIDKEAKEYAEAAEQDKQYIKQIAALPSSSASYPEKRVISFGLYGAKDKYTTGAIRNAELAKTYFPGRFISIVVRLVVVISPLPPSLPTSLLPSLPSYLFSWLISLLI